MIPLHALLIQDNENDLLSIAQALEEYGFDAAVVRADNAIDMEQALRSSRFDVVLADYRLPRFSGIEALDVLARLELDIPFILVSAVIGDGVAVDIMRRGARDYVMKENLARLGAAVEREVREAAERRARATREQLLAATQRRFQETFEHAPIGIVHTDLTGRVLMTNTRFCEIVGYSEDQLLGRWLGELTHPGDLEHERRAMADVHAGRRGTHQAEKRYIRRDGSTVWVAFSATPIRNSAREIEYVVIMVEDISRRRSAEERIRFQAHLLDAVEQAVIATDLEGKVTFWNRYAAEVYGWSEAEAVGQHILDLTAPSIPPSEASDLLNRLARGFGWSGEFELSRRDGSFFPAMVLASPIYDDDGAPTGMLGVSFDLTERKAAEAALLRSEERYRGIVEGVEEMIISATADGTISGVNGAFTMTTGWSREEIIGQPISAIAPPELRELTEARFAARLRGELTPPREGAILKKDRSTIPVESVVFARKDGDQVSEVFYFCRDLTARKLAEQERARLANELHLLLESTVEGIYAVNAEGKCTLVNRAASQILGLSEASLLGRTSHELFHHTKADGTAYDVASCPLYEVLATGCTTRRTNEVFWRSDGTAVPVAYSCAPIFDDGRIVGAVTTFTDLSPQRLLEAQLERANRLNGLGRVAATMAHEMNNVLMGIQPFAEMLRRQLVDERPRALVDAIMRSVRRGSRITGEILEFTRQSPPSVKPVAVEEWLSELCVDASAVLEQRVSFGVTADRPLVVAGDSRQLHQMFVNMIVNARDAHAQHITLHVEAAAASRYPFGVLDTDHSYAHFALTDDGGGMPTQILQHVFEPLFTTKKSGSGLGLSLAHNIVKQHGGYIFAESSEGAGTTFHVFLPLLERAAQSDATAFPERPRHLHSLLIVEDDPIVAEGLVDLLAADEVSATVIATGAEAVSAIERCTPDALLLDVGLPDMDGIEVYERVAARWPALPVVFATGHADPTRFTAQLKRANVTYISKPYDLPELYGALERVLETVRVPQAV
ncbi:MAG TPA: PAS domain S-box protein [Thermoanaerobaculia bacterium]|nr:PAS domain S-box protein [Thermoanaerobaculia bacterium]